MKKKLYVRLSGTGINQTFSCLSYEFLAGHAGNFYIFEMENGATMRVNDFGIRFVTIADSLDKLN